MSPRVEKWTFATAWALIIALAWTPAALSQFNGCGTGFCPSAFGTGFAAPSSSGPTISMDFTTATYIGCTLVGCVSVTRASSKTDLLPSSASGLQFNTFASNVTPITPGLGILPEAAHTNQLLNSCNATTYPTQCAGNTGPATQTTGTLAASAQTLWVNGSGSAALSNGTATGCAGTASQGTAVTFTPTAGTCTVTVTGSLNAFQLELGTYGHSLCISTGAAAVCAADSTVTAGALATAVNTLPFSIVVSLGGSPNATPRIIDDSTDAQTQIFLTANAARSAPSAGQIVATIGGGLDVPNAFKAGVAYSGTTGSVVANNGTVATGTNAWTSTNNPSRIGGSSAGMANAYDGYIRRIDVYNSRLPDATLKALTQ